MRQTQAGRQIAAIATLLCATLLAARASAQAEEFGSAGRFVISAERLAGLYWLDANTDAEGTTEVGPGTPTLTLDSDRNHLKAAFLGNNGGVDFATIPRVGFDFFVVENLSLGGALMYVHDSDEEDATSTATGGGGVQLQERVETDSSSGAFVISPRVGYGRVFTDHIGIWARGGITYGTVTIEQDDTTTTTTPIDTTVSQVDTTTTLSQLSLSLDAQLIIIPIDHFGIGIGPFIEIPLTGSIDVESNDDGEVTQIDGDLSLTSFGLTATLLGWL